MKLLALGDVVGNIGCEYIRKNLPEIKRKEKVDFVIANGENSADGNGILPYSAEHLFSSGVDFITGGNHTFRRNEIYSFLDENDRIIRPYNIHSSSPGNGYGKVDMGKYKIGIINLLGKSFMSGSENPFDYLDKALNEIKECSIKIIDFHAEATGEKKALGFYADGRASVLFGTHTHIQTSDAQILPNGTGYITDLGMCGPFYSVLGVEPEIIIKALKTGLPQRFKNADTPCRIEGCIFDIDETSGKTTNIKNFMTGENNENYL